MLSRPSLNKRSEVRPRSSTRRNEQGGGGTASGTAPRDQNTSRSGNSTVNRSNRLNSNSERPRSNTPPESRSDDHDSDHYVQEPTSAQPRSHSDSEYNGSGSSGDRKRKISEAINEGLVSSFNKKARTEYAFFHCVTTVVTLSLQSRKGGL